MRLEARSALRRCLRVKRRLLIVAIFLLAGAVVNVGVAWGCARWAVLEWWQNPYDFVGWPQESAKPMPVRVRGVLAPHPNGQHFGAAGIGVDYYAVTEWDERDGPYFQTDAVLAGWPARSMWGHQDVVRQDVVDEEPVVINESVSGIHFGAEDRRIPYLPIWPAFAANTLFYATLLWLPICGPFALRRFLRVRRGLCAKCAYPMGESAVCSECGTNLPKRAAASLQCQ